MQNYMTLEFPSKIGNEALARYAVKAFAEQMDPTLEEVNDICTATSEAVTNCIRYAYPDRIGRIAIRCRILKNNILDIIIKDEGVGIEDVERAMRPMFTTDKESAGMGFTIMKTFMTECHVSSRDGKGTMVHLKKKIMSRR